MDWRFGWDDPGTPDSQQSDLYDFHATTVGHTIGGRLTAVEPNSEQTGIAPGTNLVSGAIATQWSPELAANPQSRDARVVKAVLLNSADKIPGWTNDPFELDFGGPTFFVTFQALDYNSGAGALNLARAYDQYLGVGATMDVPGMEPGVAALVSSVGWDFGVVELGTDNLYFIDPLLQAGSMFTATLTWFRDRGFNLDTFGLADDGQADLDLYLIDAVTGDIAFASGTWGNNVEHIHVTLPNTSHYLLAVNYAGAIFGGGTSAEYGLAWSAAPIPEPVSGTLLLVGLGMFPFTTLRRPITRSK